MKLTRKLISHLNRVFDRSPDPVLGLRIRYDGGMTWEVEDGVLRTIVVGGTGASLQLNLANYTIATLANYVAAQPGYSVPFVSADVGGLSARTLLDASGDQDSSNGDNLLAYTSLLWAWLDPIAKELKDAAEQVDQAVLQMTPQTASGEWLDELGLYYAVPRAASEPDGLYAPRIIAEVLRPRGNNIVIAQAVDEVAGGAGVSRVTDVGLDATSNSYGLFDIDISFSLERLEQFGMNDTLTAALKVVERFRDAGTQLRRLRATVTYKVPVMWAAALTNGEDTYVSPYSATDLETIARVEFWAALVVHESSLLFPVGYTPS